MPEINRPELARALDKWGGVRGVGSRPLLSHEVVPVIIADDIQADRRIEKHAMASAVQSAAGGNVPAAELWNPTTAWLGGGSRSQVLLKLHRIILNVETTGQVVIAIHTAQAVSTGAVEIFTDRRLAGAPVGQVTQGDLAGAAGTAVINTFLITNEIEEFLFDPPIILGPGTGVLVTYLGANLDLRFSFQWSEEPLEPDEPT